MDWGKWIIVAFILFAGFIATLVTVCMRQDVSLVSKDYYKEELAYGEQLARINNANQLIEKPVIHKAGDFLKVDFGDFHKIENGSLKLFRPSDSKMDRRFTVTSSKEHTQSFPINGIERGMYRARMQWMMEGKEYFIETVVNI